MSYEIRPVHEHEWEEIRRLRLTALKDDAAPIAFLETYDDALARPDHFWQERARGACVESGDGAGARQFVAVAQDGDWVGSASVLVERAGLTNMQGERIPVDGGYVVGVYVHHDHRGRGLVGGLFEGVTAWLRQIGCERVRLHVHADNARAQAAYRRLGFTATGATMTVDAGVELEMARDL